MAIPCDVKQKSGCFLKLAAYVTELHHQSVLVTCEMGMQEALVFTSETLALAFIKGAGLTMTSDE